MIYLASSWKNPYHNSTLTLLRSWGYEVYDYRNVKFSWKDIDPNYQSWSMDAFGKSLDQPIPSKTFRTDYTALLDCHALVLLLPSGISSHIEAGWVKGHKKPVIVYSPTGVIEKDLMYKVFDTLVDGEGKLKEVLSWILN